MVGLPGFRITDTYQAYKSREKTFTTWLKATGEKLGLKLTKPKNRADKIQAAKHEISISQVQQLVNLCIERNEPLPEELRQNLKDVVRQRKEAAGFYRSKGDTKSDETHAYYMQVLKWALERFGELTGTEGTERPVPKSTTNDKEEDGKVGNAFESLEVEATIDAGALSEPNDESGKENTPKERAKPKAKLSMKKGKAKKAKKLKKNVPKKDAVLENNLLDNLIAINREQAADEDDYEEECFMIYCFFKDWNDMREYLQERWCDYQDGILSLATVSVITNTAFDLLQKSEYELFEQLAPDTEFQDFGAMAQMLFFEGGLLHVDYQAQNKKVKNHENVGAEYYEEASWVCLGMYWDLKEWLKMCPPRKIPVIAPLFKDDPLDYHADSTFRRDRHIIFELIGECCLLKALERDPEFIIPAKDEWTDGIINMLATRHIPIWLVFASQTMCDIRYILETDVAKCHDELLYQGTRVKGILETYLNFAGGFEAEPNELLTTTIGEIECWVSDDFMEPQRTKLHKEQFRPPSEYENFFYLRRHPLLCGLMHFRFSLTMNEIGLANSNQWGATIATAHLYNALRNERPSMPQWPDMEALIFIHSNQRIFWRDHLPSDPGQYARSYERATGVSEMMAQRDPSISCSNDIIRPSKIFERGIGSVSILSMQFHERFCYAQPSKIDSLPDIERVLNDSAQREIEYSLAGLRLLEDANPLAEPSALGGTNSSEMTIYRPRSEHLSSRALTSHFQQTHMLTNLELLEALCTRLAQEANALNFDYFSFHITCMLVLKAIYEEFEKEIVEADAPLDWGAAELPVVPFWLFKWMEEDEAKKEDITERMQNVMAPLVKKDGIKELRAMQKFLGGTSASKWRGEEQVVIEG